jgi:hypothetical protein
MRCAKFSQLAESIFATPVVTVVIILASSARFAKHYLKFAGFRTFNAACIRTMCVIDSGKACCQRSRTGKMALC